MTAPVWDGESIDGRTTFFSHALTLSALHGVSPWPRDGHPLPDEVPADSESVLNSTVLDGITSHHFRPEQASEEDIRSIADQFAGLALAGSVAARDLAGLHERLAERSAIGLADPLVKELRARDLPAQRLREVALLLAMGGTRREAVKVGIVALGTCGDERDRDLLVLLGSLDELTLYAVVALRATQPDRDRAVYEVARRVTGWGRVHAVERLAGTVDPEIRAWLLRDGFRNGIMYAYLAHIAATTGGLYEALLDPAPDLELLTGAGEILASLAELGGPAKDMGHYPDAVPALHRFAELIAQDEPSLNVLDSLLSLNRFVTREPEFDWPPGEPAKLAARYGELLARPAWAEMVAAHLAEPPDDRTFSRAVACATRMGIPVFTHALRHLRDQHQAPVNAYVWHALIEEATADTIGQVTDLAETVLPIARLTSGPTLKVLGPDFADSVVLEILVRALSAYPETAPHLVVAALSARVPRVRRAALATISQWPGDYREQVAAATATEPDPKLRMELERYLNDNKPR